VLYAPLKHLKIGAGLKFKATEHAEQINVRPNEVNHHTKDIRTL